MKAAGEKRARRATFLSSTLILGALLLTVAGVAFGQVSPAEIINPELKAAEAKYFPQLKALNHAIETAKFPFSFYLSRYVGLDPAQQAEADSRGMEFVRFHDRVVLKITGNYNAAYNAALLTQNQRATRVFQEVITPILQLVAQEIPADVTCDAIGFEISFHTRSQKTNYDYEGKEILVAVFKPADAFAYPQAPSDQDRQEILNRSEIYLDGNLFGLALYQPNPFDLEALGRTKQPSTTSAPPAAAVKSSRAAPLVSPKVTTDFTNPTTRAETGGNFSLNAPGPPAPPAQPVPVKPAAPAATHSDADRLQAKYQPQLDAFAKDLASRFHLVDYAPPSFGTFRSQIVLQITLRNTSRFNRDTTSIYKRAAQSFDLFLAPQLKDLLEKIPAGWEFDALDISVLNQLSPDAKTSSEAIEFVFPLPIARKFVESDITNQQLIDQSVVLVNGMRISLDLQRVE
jgi:hypothetical protein